MNGFLTICRIRGTDQYICSITTLRSIHTALPLYILQFIFIKAESGDQPYVIQILLIPVSVHGADHCLLTDAQPGIKAHTKSDNQKDCQKTPGRAQNFSDHIFPHAFIQMIAFLPSGKGRYHSIFSTDVGCSFTCIDSTCPLRTRITRSAIGQIARLCVTMTTVMLFFLQVSCSSFKMVLPVL